jgi:hypothetical protein
MTERIKELGGKALDQAVLYTWTTLDYAQIQELLACHAELIIRECADVALRENHDPYECILKHFGLDTVNDTLRRRSTYYGNNP